MSDEGPHAEPQPVPPDDHASPCAVTRLVRQMAVQGIGGVIDMQHRSIDGVIAAVDAAVLDGDEPARRVLLESANEVRLRVDMAGEVIDLVVRLMMVDPRSAHEYAARALDRLSGNAAIDYLGLFTGTAETEGLLPDKIQEDLTAKAVAEPWLLPDMLEERRRWHDHSVHFNSVSWRIAEAVGKVPEGADRVESDVDEDLTALIAERAQLAALESVDDARASETTPVVGSLAWHKERELDPRVVTRVDGESIYLDIAGIEQGPLPAANYTYTAVPSPTPGRL